MCTGGPTQAQGGSATTAGSSGSAGSGAVATGEGLSADFSKGSLVATVNGTLSPDLFRFVRDDAAAAATYFDETGTLKVAELGAPRFDHQPGSATALGLLLEPAAQNLLPEANGFPVWMEGGAASKVVAAAGAAPDATNTASNLVFTAGGGSRRFSPMLSVGAGLAVTYSVWGKAKGNADLRLEIWGTEVDPLKQDFLLSNDWQRYSMHGVGTGKPVQVLVNDVEEGGNDVLVWGAQVELGSAASSAILSSGGALMRKAEQLSASDVSWLNASQGTWRIAARPAAIDGQRVLLELAGSSAGDYISLRKAGSSAQTEWAVSVGGVETLVVEPSVAWKAGVELSVVATYAAGAITLSVNDSPAVSAAVGSLPPGYLALTVGNDKAGSKGFSGHVSKPGYLPKAP